MAGTSNPSSLSKLKSFTLKTFNNESEKNFINNETQKLLIAQKDVLINTLKERCDKLESKIQKLQSENESLVKCKAGLIIDIAQLNESKIKLRRKNLQINEELQIKNKETYEAMENISVISKDHAYVESQYFKLQLENKKLKEELTSADETNLKLQNRVEWLSNQLQYEVKSREDIENEVKSSKNKIMVDAETQCDLIVPGSGCSSRTYKVDKSTRYPYLLEEKNTKEFSASLNTIDLLDWGALSGCDMSSVVILKSYFSKLLKHIEVQNITLKNCMERFTNAQKVNPDGLKADNQRKDAGTNVNLDVSENVCPICMNVFDMYTELEEHVYDHFHNDPEFDMEVERRIQEIL